MFSYEFKKDGNANLVSGTSAVPTTGAPSDYAETDPINLTAKWNDGKNFSLYIDVPTLSGDSATSAYLDFYIAGGHASGTTFAIDSASGSSLIINNTILGGTSQGSSVEYRKFQPLTIILNSGVTGWLKSVPYITLGCRSTWHKGSGASVVGYNAWLMVG